MNEQSSWFSNLLVVVKGAGDLASGSIYRLVRVGFPVIATEIPHPTVVRRTVSFAEAIYSGEITVEGVTARKAESFSEALELSRAGMVAVIIDPEARIVAELKPPVIVDSIMAKRNLGTKIGDAPVVIGLGPGFTAGVDCHAVIETNRGHDLGRVILEGQAEPDTGVPGSIGGYAVERLLRAPTDGSIEHIREIGDEVKAGEVVATVDGEPVISQITGVLRGLVREGIPVSRGLKIGDVDPRAKREHCFTISDKSLAIGGGVLEATLYLLRQRQMEALGVPTGRTGEHRSPQDH